MAYKYFCEKCNYGSDFVSHWNRHLNTSLHKTGKRANNTTDTSCELCDYKTTSATNMITHRLNNHSTKDERKDKFKYYCEICDFGTMAKSLYDKHNNSQKHKLVFQYANNK